MRFRLKARQTKHHSPAAAHQAAQGELAKPQDFFDDPDHGFDRTFAQAINRSPDLGLQLVSHLVLWTGIFAGRFRQLVEKAVPILMMGLASRGNVRLNATLLASLQYWAG